MDRIFKDPLTTASAIDRFVRHAVILETTGTSVRADEASQAQKKDDDYRADDDDPGRG